MNSKRAKLHLGQTLIQLVRLFWILSIKLLFNKLFKVTQKLHENTQADQEILQIDDEPSFESARHIANQSLELLDFSPIKMKVVNIT